MKRFWPAAVLLILAVIVAVELLAVSGPGRGDPAPPFRATALDGRGVDVGGAAGRQVVLLNFFSSH